ncbi:Cg6329, isoform a [Plakobranchus ocellatus]|uniref:Cg6329, isoform a n=1 Tax=Plakobranchus ocellatus TaxID=259542 RepID=A0AAV3ZH09_9GAST|nr:Cg6329, isoform a [Plakobranchus ocellatus]
MDSIVMVLSYFMNDMMRLFVFMLVFGLGDASLQCYRCNNLDNPACNQYFKAYQFESITCPTLSNGDEPFCGKQQQPPLKNGWVGVIRSCYYPGDLPDMNETLGCHLHIMVETNFSAIYCLCDKDLCNGATSVSAVRRMFRRKQPLSATALSFLASFACPVILTASALIGSFTRRLD